MATPDGSQQTQQPAEQAEDNRSGVAGKVAEYFKTLPNSYVPAIKRAEQQCRHCNQSFIASQARKEFLESHITKSCRQVPAPLRQELEADIAARKAVKGRAVPAFEQQDSRSVKRSKQTQGLLASVVDAPPLTPALKEKFNFSVLRYVAAHGLPFSTVDSPHFLAMFNCIRPKLTPPGEGVGDG